MELNANFKRWFGDSKIVDDNGNPLVVYHGTCDEICEFDHDFAGTTTGNNNGAFFFTNDEDVADDYSRQAFMRRFQDVEPEDIDLYAKDYNLTDRQIELIKNGDVDTAAEEQIHKLGCYLCMENPLVIDCQGDTVPVELCQKLIDYCINGTWDEELWDYLPEQDYTQEQIDDNEVTIKEYLLDIEGMDADDITPEIMQQYARDALAYYGVEMDVEQYDGIIMANGVDSISDLSDITQSTYCVFHPNQIKSVDNNGDWSLSSNNIHECSIKELNELLETYINEWY